jgi:hypothetical protein
LPIKEKFQLQFEEDKDASKSSGRNVTESPIETESKHRIKIILNILSDEELNRTADKHE